MVRLMVWNLLRAAVLCALFATCAAAQALPGFEVETYDVRDLLRRGRSRVVAVGGGAGSFSFDGEEEEADFILDPDMLETIVTNSIGEDNWDDPASIELRDGRIVVNQTRERHVQIREVLANLRRHAGWSVQLETRLVDLTDDFLRDIGVDFRDVDARLELGSSSRPRSVGALDPRPIGGAGQAPRFGSSLFRGVLDGGNAFFGGMRLNSAGVVSGGRPNWGRPLQAALLERFQRSAILGADGAAARREVVQGPVITAANRQRVRVSMTTQRAYVTGEEMVDPIIATFEEGVVLDVRPTISRDRSYVTLDVRLTSTAFSDERAESDMGVDAPQLSVQTARTSVTLPEGGTVLLDGLRRSANGNLLVLVTARQVARRVD
jgi:general secretion pathway protein D